MVWYGTADAARAYWAARGYDINVLDDDDIDVDLLVASEWLDGVYRSSFPGFKVGMRAQVREWPRNDATDLNGYYIDAATVPIEIENATYEAAYRNHKSPGSLATDYVPPKYDSVSIEGALSVKYASGSAGDFQGQYVTIDRILAPILTGNGGAQWSALSGGASRI